MDSTVPTKTKSGFGAIAAEFGSETVAHPARRIIKEPSIDIVFIIVIFSYNTGLQGQLRNGRALEGLIGGLIVPLSRLA